MIAYLLPLAFQASTSLDALLDSNPSLAGASYAVTISRMNGEILFNRNGGRRLIPASNQKLLSTIYAVHTLGLNFRPKTTIIECADQIGVISEGDPSMSTARLVQIGKDLVSRNKPVYVQQAYRPGVPSGWESDDLINRYAAPVYAFTVDQGAFKVESVAGVVKPLPSELGVILSIKPSKGAVRVKYFLEQQKVSIEGDLGTDDKTLETLALREPDRSAARFLGTRFANDPLPKYAEPFSRREYFGDPMPKLLADCLQPSDNQYAEQLLLMAAAKRGLIKDPTTPYGPARADEQKFFETVVGVPVGDLRPVDGSGLARQNLVTTRAIAKMLQWSASQPWFPVFDAALASPGVGTLKSRLAGSTFRGKTGTLTSVVGLSGYVNAPTGERLIVSIVINNTVDTSAKVRDCADQIIRWVETSPTFGPALVYSNGHERSPIQEAISNTGTFALAGNRILGPRDDCRTALPWAHR